MRSLRDLEDCQEGSGSISDCQVGRDENSRLSESLMDSEVSSIQQGLLMKMGSVDLIVCQESSGSIPYCQVGRDEQVNFDQPEELTEQMRLSEGLINSEMSLDQHVQLTEEEDMRGSSDDWGNWSIPTILPRRRQKSVLQMVQQQQKNSQL
jgi:hypothetical protein